jgi:hypothetical protein
MNKWPTFQTHTRKYATATCNTLIYIKKAQCWMEKKIAKEYTLHNTTFVEILSTPIH